MKFNALHQMIPTVTGGKEKVLRMQPYDNITLRMPGRHQNETNPPGLDFVVCVSDKNMKWREHQFTHTDIFRDVEIRYSTDTASEGFMKGYYKIVNGADPDESVYWSTPAGCVETITFMRAVQCLAVAEHRRYAQYENKFGGRFLPFRFAAGIGEGLWTALDATEKQKMGRPGVEWLEREYGLPVLTKELTA